MVCKHKNTFAVYRREKLPNSSTHTWVKLEDYRYCLDCKKLIKVEAKTING